MEIGKIDYNTLKRVLVKTGYKRKEVLVGPSIGEDAAVIRIGRTKYVLVVHTDPISEAYTRLGWLAVNVAANDVAVSGARPLWFTVTILLPPGSNREMLDNIMQEIDEAANQLKAAVVGGHTEVTPGLAKPIVVATCMGLTKLEKYIRTGGALAGDLVFQVKPVALEGTSILARDFKDILLKRGVDPDLIGSAEELINDISVVEPAILLAENGLVNSMHDPTEGGLIGGLVELSKASGTSLVIDSRKVIVRRETLEISKALGIDYLKLISSGSIIGTIKEDGIREASRLMEENGWEFSIIGKVVERSNYDVYVKDKSSYYSGFVRDEISRLFETYYPRGESNG